MPKTEKEWEKQGEKFGERMEEWGEGFGKRMGAEFSHAHHYKKHAFGIGTILIALFILTWGVIWLGNDLGWWNIPFPFWPVVLILIALAILLSQIRKMF